MAKCRSLVQADWDETVDKQWARDNKREVKLIKSSFDELGTDNTIATAQLDAVTIKLTAWKWLDAVDNAQLARELDTDGSGTVTYKALINPMTLF